MYTLIAAKRATKGVRTRTEGKLPGIVYGAGARAESIAINPAEFVKLYKQAGESTLIDFSLEGKAEGKVLVQEVQHDPVNDRIIHVDLRRIDMNKALTAPVALRFIGEAPVIKASGGTLVTSLETVEVKCLPKDLVSHIDVDVSGLNSYEDVIKIKDLKLPPGIQIVSPSGTEALVAKAAPALTEEEIKKMEEAGTAAVDVSNIELAKKKEAPAEGEAETAEEGKEGKKPDAAGATKAAKKEEKPEAAKKKDDKK